MEDFGGVRVLLLLPIIVLGLVILLWALVDVIRRPESRLRYLPKWAWLLVVLLGSTLGQLTYLILGRDNSVPSTQGDERAVTAEKAASAADVLYGRREDEGR